MSDNSGTPQKIRDAFSTVNQFGNAFRNARILPAYLDARLAELDCAVRMREFVQKVRMSNAPKENGFATSRKRSRTSGKNTCSGEGRGT